MNFTQEDIKNLIILVNKAPLTGAEAPIVTLLQQKLTAMLTPEEPKPVKK